MNDVANGGEGRGRLIVASALFSFSGRIGRQAYVLGQMFLLSLFAVVVARILAVRGQEYPTTLWGLALLALLPAAIWAMLALTVKRLRDTGWPAPLALVLFVPTAKLVLVLALMAWPGRPDNGHRAQAPGN
jgi:uncharacterized membrane protein YhaH (DUF805 family)